MAALLEFLAAETLTDAQRRPSAKLIAESVLGVADPDSRSATAAVRMQAGRLRKLLDRYYTDEGAHDAIRIELPLREYRLRFLRDGQPVTAGDTPTPTGDAPVLFVATPRCIVPEPAPDGIAEAFASNLLAELGGHSLVTTIGPASGPRLSNRAAGGLDRSFQQPATFVLDTALQSAGEHVRVLASLSQGLPARQVWSQALEFSAAPTAAGRSMAAAARKLAADVADECGVIVREILRASAAKPGEDLSAVEAMASLWRYWITGTQDDLAFARLALDHAVAKMPDSPLLLVFWAAAACQEYTSSLDPRARLPDLVTKRMEQARRAALGNPWVELVRAYALWLMRHPSALSAAIEQLEAARGSPTFRGMVGSIRIAADLDADRGRALVAAAIAESPQPLLWFHICAALHDLRRGDLDAAERGLARIDSPTRPEPVVLQAAVAAARGDLAAARRIIDLVTDAMPEFPVVGEVILRRWLHDDHVDSLAALLQPLGIDWFHRPTIGMVRE